LTEEFAAPYYELADEGVQIDIATPLGQPQSILKVTILQRRQRIQNDDTEVLAKLKKIIM
jgi:putative intracellular protease/amidase